MRRCCKILLYFFLTLAVIPACLSAYYFWPVSKIPDNVEVTKIVVLKGERKLYLYSGEDRIAGYGISLGGQPVGDKQCQGDMRTPEGNYVLDYKNPQSSCYKSFHISYPNPSDRQEAALLGCSPGDDIMIHGIANGQGRLRRFQRFWDWTHGCIALTNDEMDQLWRIVPAGTPIEIKR